MSGIESSKTPEAIDYKSFRNRAKKALILTLIAVTGAVATGSEAKGSNVTDEVGKMTREMGTLAMDRLDMTQTAEHQEDLRKVLEGFWQELSALITNKTLTDKEEKELEKTIQDIIIKYYREWDKLDLMTSQKVYAATASNFLKTAIKGSNCSGKASADSAKVLGSSVGESLLRLRNYYADRNHVTEVLWQAE